MDEVYRNAYRVVAWLGEGTEVQCRWMQELLDASIHDGLSDAKLRRLLLVLTDLFHNLFWERLWVYQEISLSANVVLQYGPVSVLLQSILDIEQALYVAWTNQQLVNLGWEFDNDMTWGPTTRACNLLRRLRDRSNAPHLPELIYLLRNQQCSDDRDRFYVVIGLMSAEEKAHCSAKVDYRKSTEETYEEIAFTIVSRYGLDGALSILSINGLRSGSWAPIWHEEMYDHPLAPGLLNPAQDPLYGASRYWQVDKPEENLATVKPNSGHLEIKGTLVDTVKHVFQIEALDEMVNILEEHFHVHDQTRALDVGELMWMVTRTILEGRIMILRELFVRLSASISVDEQGEIMQRLADAMAVGNLRGNRLNRCIFITEAGRVGNGPKATQCGDRVVVIPKAQVPHLLRPGLLRRPQISRYDIVGECYLDGAMDGEFFKHREPQHIRTTSIEISGLTKC